jgi:hypothetical protein
MIEVLLDRQGIAPIQEGYQLVTSDIDFLKIAVGEGKIQIRSALCDWAEDFCKGRGIPCRELLSPVSEIVAICPTITPEQAEQAYHAIGQRKYSEIDRPLTIAKILNAISPCQLWEGATSRNHAADWLIWLIDFKPEEYFHPLLKTLCDYWVSKATGAERVAYSVQDVQSALSVIKGWIGLSQAPVYKNLSDFPRAVPVSIKNEARSQWKKQFVETRGSFLANALHSPMHNALKSVLAEEAYLHFKKRQKDFTRDHFDALAPFLSWQEQQDLRVMLPPLAVLEMPDDPHEVLAWFRESYLPYRGWQFETGDEEARAILDARAKQFAKWYLARYPKALSSGNMGDCLSFAKIVTITQNSKQFVTLVVVLDGLHVGDGRTLNVQLREQALRLNVVVDDVAFTAIPTVTEFCKSALFMGVQPNQAESVQPIGHIIPENELPSSRLSTAILGDIFLWRIQEPDRTYHSKGKNDAVLRKVEAELSSFVKIINDIAEQVPSNIPLQIIITTDHGRLIDIAKRKIPVPEEMSSHGRAAWGKTDIDFGQSDYVIIGNLAYLKGERFGMKYDMALPLDNQMFFAVDGKGGQEAFPHGGLYPEEVIVPWIVFVRDYVKPEVSVTLAGAADAGKSGKLNISINNYGEVVITMISIELLFGDRKIRIGDLDASVSGRAIENVSVEIQQWPTSAEIKHAQCECYFRQPNGSIFVVNTSTDLRSNEMYTSDNILEDLL